LNGDLDQAAEESAMSTVSQCPDCDYEMHFVSKPDRSIRVTCPRCMSVLRVIKLEPLLLDWDFVEPLEGGLFFGANVTRPER